MSVQDAGDDDDVEVRKYGRLLTPRRIDYVTMVWCQTPKLSIIIVHCVSKEFTLFGRP